MSFSGVREERLKTPLPKSPPPRSDVLSPAKSVLRSPKFEAPNALDAQFSALVHDIQQRLALLARAPTIRVEKWLRKLHDPVSNVTWKKLRNDYARLLRHNLSLGATSPPFDRAPDDGPLRNLLPDEKARFKCYGFGGFAEKKKRASSTSKTLFDGAHTNDGDVERREINDVIGSSSAETALRDLLRRAEVAGAPRQLGAAEIAVAVPQPLQGLFTNDEANPFIDVDRVSAEKEDSVLTGAPSGVSREMRAFIAAEGVDEKNHGESSLHSRFGDSKNADVVDVVAALGAEREKSKELEWRLRRAETALETCRRELSETRLAANAMRDLKAEEIREIRASHKRELDRLIATFERRRAEVHAPRVAASLRVAGVDTLKENRRGYGGSGFVNRIRDEGASAAEKEKDFFAYLEAFQRGTGELRKRATSGE